MSVRRRTCRHITGKQSLTDCGGNVRDWQAGSFLRPVFQSCPACYFPGTVRALGREALRVVFASLAKALSWWLGFQWYYQWGYSLTFVSRSLPESSSKCLSSARSTAILYVWRRHQSPILFILVESEGQRLEISFFDWKRTRCDWIPAKRSMYHLKPRNKGAGNDMLLG